MVWSASAMLRTQFQGFVALDAGGTLTMTALTNGQIQAGDLFSTDPVSLTNALSPSKTTIDVAARERRSR